jgi:ribosomal protein S27E
MNSKYIFVFALSAAMMAATAWATFPGKTRSLGDPSKLRYMHCPECERESMYSPAASEKPCQYCDKSLVPTEDSIKVTGAGGSPYTRMFLAIFVEVLGLMAIVWLMGRKRHEKEEGFLYMNCDSCRQKIRYREGQIGQVAMCRRCKSPFLYPSESVGQV